MVNNDNNLETLKKYLKSKYDINPKNITSETSLLYDLEIKGDDVDEFFSALIKDFNIEVNRLNLSRFFVGDEPFDFMSPIVRFFKGENKDKKPTITIGEIERFINTGILE